MTRNHIIALSVTLLLLAAGGTAYGIVRRKKKRASGNESAASFPLKKGSIGNEVLALQKFLNYSDSSYKLKESAIFDEATRKAVQSETGNNTVDAEYFVSFVKPFLTKDDFKNQLSNKAAIASKSDKKMTQVYASPDKASRSSYGYNHGQRIGRVLDYYKDFNKNLWYKVKDEKGREGWVFGSEVKLEAI